MLENETIIRMHNLGSTFRQISEETKFSKSKVHRIIAAHLEATQSNELPNIEIKQTVPSGNIFSSFVGWLRIGLNQYSNKDTGEVVSVKFVPAGNASKCGHFITV